jgi:hypothetical protein
MKALGWLYSFNYAVDTRVAFNRCCVQRDSASQVPYAAESVIRIFYRNTANNSVHLVSLFEEHFCQVRSVLTGNSCKEGSLFLGLPRWK